MDLTRGMSTQMKNALRGYFHPNLLCFIDWPGDPLRFHLGQGTISWRGEIWYGAGPLASIQLPPEAPGMANSSAMISIAGTPIDLDGRIDDAVRGRSVEINFATVTSRQGGTLLGSPVNLFQGTMGAMRQRTSRDGDDILNAIEVDISTGPSARAKSSVYHSDEDQKRFYPSDTAGRLVILSYAKAQKLRWPAA